MPFENMSKAELDVLNLEYLPRLTIANVDEYLENAAARSAAVRERLECHIDVSYGDTPGQTIDVFPAPLSGAPVFFFIHGGYWRSLDKHYYSELAGPMVAAGATAMLLNYDLCPAVTITDIVEQVRRGLAWAHANAASYNADADRMHVCGHSAGGHLTGMMMATDWSARFGLPADLIKGAAPLSGLFDIEPHRHTDLQADIRLSAKEAAANSPQHLTIRCRAPIVCAVGGGESESFKRQSREFTERCVGLGLACEYVETGSDNHFDITDRLGNAEDALTRSLVRQMGL